MLAAPKLDDRKFQDLVDEAKKRIPHYCKEWTDHNVSDPGVTLIELFAWLTEMTLFRLNRVPERHTVKFMEMLGISLQAPAPAQVPVTFWLSSPADTAVVIPAGTEVASTQTETESSIIFSTDEDFTIDPPQLKRVFSRVTASQGRGKQYAAAQNLRRLAAGIDDFAIYSAVPQVDDALYFGFENDLSQHILGFDMEWDPAGGAGIDPTLPPVIWEASSGDKEDRWLPCDVEIDSTKGMNSNGRIQIHLPRMGQAAVNKQVLFWVRVRVKEISSAGKDEGMRPYQVSPKLRRLAAASWGGTTAATHAQVVSDEFLGQSDGSTGQQFQLQISPILDRAEGEQLEVQASGQEPQLWREVRDFADSDSDGNHYTLDSVSGELQFGPAVRQPDGTIKLYGAIPPRGANLVFGRYRTGGGQEGNVQPQVLNTLKTAIPYIDRVSNREPAWGGLDAETLEAAVMRAPKLLRSRDRAVTESDFEFLARQALPAAIGRVKCLQPRPSESGRVEPGRVFVLVIPRVPQPAGFLTPEQLVPEDADLTALQAYLDERRLLTTRLDIRAPAYRWVSARVQLRANPDAEEAEVEAAVMARLHLFLNPFTGGPQGNGWPFGRELFLSDVYQCLQGLPDVQFIRAVELFAAAPGAGRQGDAVERVEVVVHGVIASGIHEVAFV